MSKLEQAETAPAAKPIGKEGRELWFKEVIDTTNAVFQETDEIEQTVSRERIEEHRALTSRNNAVVKESSTVQEQAEQEPIKRFTSDDIKVAFENGYAAAMSVAEISEEAKQEPVAWLWVCEHGSERLEWEPVEDDSKWKSKPLYAAPVRTKDLTDDEIEKAFWGNGDTEIEGCRAVIAAFKEKNK